jgi:predicted nucleic acid-binding protein
MAASVVADAGFLVALLSRRDSNHRWARAAAERFPPPWRTCEAALSEAYHLLTRDEQAALSALLTRRAVLPSFALVEHIERVLEFLDKYADVPMGFADACLVRMSETLADVVVLTTDADFGIYRRHGRQAVPHVAPDRRRR